MEIHKIYIFLRDVRLPSGSECLLKDTDGTGSGLAASAGLWRVIAGRVGGNLLAPPVDSAGTKGLAAASRCCL
jgi:hypothetical protein